VQRKCKKKKELHNMQIFLDGNIRVEKKAKTNFKTLHENRKEKLKERERKAR